MFESDVDGDSLEDAVLSWEALIDGESLGVSDMEVELLLVGVELLLPLRLEEAVLVVDELTDCDMVAKDENETVDVVEWLNEKLGVGDGLRVELMVILHDDGIDALVEILTVWEEDCVLSESRRDRVGVANRVIL